MPKAIRAAFYSSCTASNPDTSPEITRLSMLADDGLPAGQPGWRRPQRVTQRPKFDRHLLKGCSCSQEMKSPTIPGRFSLGARRMYSAATSRVRPRNEIHRPASTPSSGWRSTLIRITNPRPLSPAPLSNGGGDDRRLVPSPNCQMFTRRNRQIFDRFWQQLVSCTDDTVLPVS